MSVLVVSWVLSGGSRDEAVQSALLAASMGAAFGSIEYRYRFNIAAISFAALWPLLVSMAWCLPFLWAALRFPFPPKSVSEMGLMVFLAALLCVVCLIPLRWMHGQWMRDDGP
ncbi:MAG TPA: hypothetical protein VFN29_06980 [Chiayiivirga sp.]|nr:hypothetical protein [Chiayiivirga sp.]